MLEGHQSLTGLDGSQAGEFVVHTSYSQSSCGGEMDSSACIAQICDEWWQLTRAES